MNDATRLLLLPGQQPAEPAPIFNMLMPMILIFMIFYLLVMRPQQKKQREHEVMLKAIEKGDSVVTSGGLYGKVTGTTDDILTVEIAALKGERVRVKVARGRIDSVEKTKKGDDS